MRKSVTPDQAAHARETCRFSLDEISEHKGLPRPDIHFIDLISVLHTCLEPQPAWHHVTGKCCPNMLVSATLTCPGGL